MPSRAMRRASRSAPALLQGEEIFRFVTGKSTRKKLVAAAAEGLPPVSAISADLRERFEAAQIKRPVIKQFVGLCVRAVLEEEGYEVYRTGVRLHRDPVFTTGSVYRPVQLENRAKTATAVERMLTALTESEALLAARALERAFPGILKRARIG